MVVENTLIKDFKVNKGFLVFYVLSIGLSGACMCWTTAGNNQTAGVFAAKLNWTSEELRINDTLINLFSQIGKMLGAFLGGHLIESGRKEVFIKYSVLSIISCHIMQYLSIWTLCLGKLLNGIFVTVVVMACGKMINETVPVYLLETYGIIVQ